VAAQVPGVRSGRAAARWVTCTHLVPSMHFVFTTPSPPFLILHFKLKLTLYFLFVCVAGRTHRRACSGPGSSCGSPSASPSLWYGSDGSAVINVVSLITRIQRKSSLHRLVLPVRGAHSHMAGGMSCRCHEDDERLSTTGCRVPSPQGLYCHAHFAAGQLRACAEARGSRLGAATLEARHPDKREAGAGALDFYQLRSDESSGLLGARPAK
jgi:hypothetical protein